MIMVVIGAALDSFTDYRSVLAFLECSISTGELDPTLDPGHYGAKFMGRAPWQAVTLEDRLGLIEIMKLEIKNHSVFDG
jgi:hypothetical protein